MGKAFDIICDGFGFSHRLCDEIIEKPNNINKSSYLLLYIADGRVHLTLPDTEICLQPRTLVLLSPAANCSLDADVDCQAEIYSLSFEKNALLKEITPLLDSILAKNNGGDCKVYTATSLSQNIVSIFDKIEYSDNFPSEERAIYIKLLLSELLVLLSVIGTPSASRNDEELAAGVAKYINEHLEGEISLDKLAKSFFVSKYYLCRSFKKYCGISIHAYINNKRIIYAKQLIEAGEPASSAAYKVGFGDYSAFYRAYVKLIGTPPSMKTKK